MAELDAWTQANVIMPLVYSEDEDGGERTFEQVNDLFNQVKFAVRQKVLESYKNGCKAGAGHVRREYSQPQPKGHQVAASGVAR